MIQGGCFCGALRYAVEGSLANARSCHCSQCRKAFSGAGSAYAEVSDEARFEWVSDTKDLKVYESVEGWGLAFCSNWGLRFAAFIRITCTGLRLAA